MDGIFGVDLIELEEDEDSVNLKYFGMLKAIAPKRLK